jgi:hypothetical protein
VRLPPLLANSHAYSNNSDPDRYRQKSHPLVLYPFSIHQSLPYILMAGADGQVAARRRSCRTSLRSHDEDQVSKMTRTELIIQLLKIAIGLAFGAYFVWWSLEVLDRLAPENEAPTPAVGHPRGRAHYDSRNARRFAIDVDARVRIPRGPHADTRLAVAF